MSIVKDFLLISFFLFLITRNFLLYKKLINERKYFIDTLNHDLKVATIAQIRGISLLKKNSNNEELVQSLQDSTFFSLDLINMLTNTYKYKNKEQFLLFEAINITEIINQTFYDLSDIAQIKNVALEYKTNCINQIYADRNEIKKAVLILLSTAINNAIKDSLIKIEIEETNKNIIFSISYNGLGLKEEEYKRMFFRNPRFSTVGHGIKMHLCKKIIDFHKGSIKIKTDRNKNYFIFTVPNVKKREITQKQLLPKLQAYHLQ